MISLQYVKSRFNLADPLSKGLGKELVVETCNGKGIKPVVNKLFFMVTLPNDVILGSKEKTSEVTIVKHINKILIFKIK